MLKKSNAAADLYHDNVDSSSGGGGGHNHHHTTHHYNATHSLDGKNLAKGSSKTQLREAGFACEYTFGGLLIPVPNKFFEGYYLPKVISTGKCCYW